MKKLLHLGGGSALLALGAVGGFFAYDHATAETYTESLCDRDMSSDAAVVNNTDVVALVTVLDKGKLYNDPADADGSQTFKVRSEAVFKGALPAEAQVVQGTFPVSGNEALAPGGRYEIALDVLPAGTYGEGVTFPEAGAGSVAFARPAKQSVQAFAEHWKAEQAKKYSEPPCEDTAVVE